MEQLNALPRAALVTRLRETQAQVAALKRAEALARQRCDYFADSIRAGRSDKGAAARQADAARKAVAQHEEDRKALLRRVENQAAFLRKEKEAREALEAGLTAEKQRSSTLAVQLQGAEQQLKHMQDLLDEARQQYRHFLGINKQAVEHASRQQDRLRRTGAALSSARHEALVSRIARVQAEQQVAGMRRLVEDVYLNKASGQLGQALQDQIAAVLQAARVPSAASATARMAEGGPELEPSPESTPGEAFGQRAATEAQGGAAAAARAAQHAADNGMPWSSVMGIAAAAAAGMGDATPGVPVPPDGGAGPKGLAAGLIATLAALGGGGNGPFRQPDAESGTPKGFKRLCRRLRAEAELRGRGCDPRVGGARPDPLLTTILSSSSAPYRSSSERSGGGGRRRGDGLCMGLGQDVRRRMEGSPQPSDCPTDASPYALGRKRLAQRRDGPTPIGASAKPADPIIRKQSAPQAAAAATRPSRQLALAGGHAASRQDRGQQRLVRRSAEPSWALSLLPVPVAPSPSIGQASAQAGLADRLMDGGAAARRAAASAALAAASQTDMQSAAAAAANIRSRDLSGKGDSGLAVRGRKSASHVQLACATAAGVAQRLRGVGARAARMGARLRQAQQQGLTREGLEQLQRHLLEQQAQDAAAAAAAAKEKGAAAALDNVLEGGGPGAEDAKWDTSSGGGESESDGTSFGKVREDGGLGAFHGRHAPGRARGRQARAPLRVLAATVGAHTAAGNAAPLESKGGLATGAWDAATCSDSPSSTPHGRCALGGTEASAPPSVSASEAPSVSQVLVARVAAAAAVAQRQQRLAGTLHMASFSHESSCVNEGLAPVVSGAGGSSPGSPVLCRRTSLPDRYGGEGSGGSNAEAVVSSNRREGARIEGNKLVRQEQDDPLRRAFERDVQLGLSRERRNSLQPGLPHGAGPNVPASAASASYEAVPPQAALPAQRSSEHRLQRTLLQGRSSDQDFSSGESDMEGESERGGALRRSSSGPDEPCGRPTRAPAYPSSHRLTEALPHRRSAADHSETEHEEHGDGQDVDESLRSAAARDLDESDMQSVAESAYTGVTAATAATVASSRAAKPASAQRAHKHGLGSRSMEGPTMPSRTGAANASAAQQRSGGQLLKDRPGEGRARPAVSSQQGRSQVTKPGASNPPASPAGLGKRAKATLAAGASRRRGTNDDSSSTTSSILAAVPGRAAGGGSAAPGSSRGSPPGPWPASAGRRPSSTGGGGGRGRASGAAGELRAQYQALKRMQREGGDE